MNGHHPPTASHDGNTVCDEVIRILHRIGERTGITEYQNIAATSWIPDLRGWGIKIGYQCLLTQALKLEQHMLAKHESGELKGKRHNPRNKLFQVWLPRVFDNEKTTGDLDILIISAPSKTPMDFDV